MRPYTIHSLVMACGLVAVPALASDPVEITSPVEKIYVPKGFDDNDNVEVALKGKFKSSCFKVGHSAAKVNHELRTIELSATAFEYDGVCSDVLVPFLQIVKVGKLGQGEYTVSVKNAQVAPTKMDVSRRTTEAPDEFLYAPVEDAVVRQDPATRRQTVQLKGTYPYCFNGCMKIREVRTTRNDDVLVVLPISDIITGPECEERQGNQSFEVTVPMTEPFQGEGLMHVRVLNGTSVNKFIELY